MPDSASRDDEWVALDEFLATMTPASGPQRRGGTFRDQPDT